MRNFINIVEQASIGYEDVTNNPAFNAWFSDSKIVDDHGNPLVVYHGGTNWRIAPGTTWFSDSPSVAYGYADQGYGDEGEIKACYLRIRNPLDLRDMAVVSSVFPDGLSDFAHPAYANRDADWILRTNREPIMFAIEYAHSHGYDGIIHPDTNVANKGRHTSYVIFRPDQVKAAHFQGWENELISGEYPMLHGGNKGTFRRDHDDVTESAPVREMDGRSDFETWFGNSKVVDETGHPLTVYHGTNQTFDTFSKAKGGMVTGAGAGAIHGFFFTDDRDEAQQYAEGAGRKVFANMDAFEAESERLRLASERLERVAQRTGRAQDWEAYEQAYATWEQFETDAPQADPMENVQVIAAHLSIQNPLEVDFHGGGGLNHGNDVDGIGGTVDMALAQGYDGVIFRNINDSPLGGFVSTHYVAFSPEQIRRS